MVIVPGQPTMWPTLPQNTVHSEIGVLPFTPRVKAIETEARIKAVTLIVEQVKIVLL